MFSISRYRGYFPAKFQVTAIIRSYSVSSGSGLIRFSPSFFTHFSIAKLQTNNHYQNKFKQHDMKLTWTGQSVHSLILCVNLLNFLEKVFALALPSYVNLTSISTTPLHNSLILIFKDEVLLSLFVKLDLFRLLLVYWWRHGLKRHNLMIICVGGLTTMCFSKRL